MIIQLVWSGTVPSPLYHNFWIHKHIFIIHALSNEALMSRILYLCGSPRDSGMGKTDSDDKTKTIFTKTGSKGDDNFNGYFD